MRVHRKTAPLRRRSTGWSPEPRIGGQSWQGHLVRARNASRRDAGALRNRSGLFTHVAAPRRLKDCFDERAEVLIAISLEADGRVKDGAQFRALISPFELSNDALPLQIHRAGGQKSRASLIK